MRRARPLIIGGGPAGAAAAIALAEGGLSPRVLERSLDADPLCGGFLSWQTLASLDDCGIDVFALGARRISRARIIAHTRMAEWDLPAVAAGLSRRALDGALLGRAEAAGAEVRRGVTVRAIDGRTVRRADGSAWHGEPVILATGKHDLRGSGRPVMSTDPAIGLRWRFRAAAALETVLAEVIELHLFAGGYAGIILQEEGHANLCLAARRSLFDEAGRRPDALLARLCADLPQLAARLRGHEIGAAQAVANVPYGWIASNGADPFYRIGDQAGVIPSLAGEGVGIAIASGMAAAEAILNGRGVRTFQPQLARRIGLPIRTAGWLWRIAETPPCADFAVWLAAKLPGVARAAMRMTRA